MIINDDNPEGIKYVTLQTYEGSNWFVIEVDPGFNSKDKLLQEMVDAFLRRKNLHEFDELDTESEKESAYFGSKASLV